MTENLSHDFLSQDVAPSWSQNDNLRLLEMELEFILDPKIKGFTSFMLSQAEAFWEAPVSDGGNYLSDEMEAGGLLLHTKRTVKAFLAMEETLECSNYDRDCAISALLIRNITKALRIDDHITYDALHTITIDRYLEYCLSIAQETGVDIGAVIGIPPETVSMILRLVHTSLGCLAMIPETLPVTILEKGVALADIITSNIPLILEDNSE